LSAIHELRIFSVLPYSIPLPYPTLDLIVSFFLFSRSAAHRYLLSFPTRRSSDLTAIDHFAETGKEDKASKHMTNLTQMLDVMQEDRKSTRLNSSHVSISYAVFCLKKKNTSILPPT